MMNDDHCNPASSRKRSAPATRQAILEAARDCFAQESYDQVGVREIASMAGIDPALINRYFGSKEGLFREAIGGKFDMRTLFAGDRSSLAERLLMSAIMKPIETGHDPLQALLRSAGNDFARQTLRDAISAGFVEPLAAELPGPHPRERAELIGSLLLGLLAYRAIVGPTTIDEQRQLIAATAPWLQAVIDGNDTTTHREGNEA
ncbi:MAG: TetR family transcriptional regulator [Thermomicrobiales bacterium]